MDIHNLTYDADLKNVIHNIKNSTNTGWSLLNRSTN